MNIFDDIGSLKKAGFQGFCSICVLRETRLECVPDKAGVYIIVRDSDQPVTFLRKSPAGHFKGQDPTVRIKELRAEWVEGTVTLYIGKAGGPGQNATIRKRIGAYIKFGSGKPVAHQGGRLIWQLERSESFLICWKETPMDDPRDIEKGLIEQFKRTHGGQRPFANLRS
jgi:hypothetical protein